jgi:serine/threonine-protein kinase
VYSLTCVLVECLTGAPPFAGDTVQALAVAHRSTPPPRASVSQAVPADFDDVIARGMAKNPAHRYRSATDLAAAARAAVGVAAQPAQPVLPMPPQSARPAPPRRRRSVLIGILCAAIVIALCVMIGVVATGTDTAASERGEDMAPPSQTSQEPAPTTYGPQVALPFTSLNGPQGLALAADGDILVADMNNVRVVRLAPATGVQTTLPFTGLTQPVDVAVDRAGNVFVADFADSMVLRLQADTAVQSQVPLVNLIHNSSVVVDDSGNVYAEGFKIFDMVMVPGGNGPGKVVPFDGINLGDFDVDSLGDVYAIDISKNRVVRLDADWRTQTVLPFSDIDPNSIAVGGDGSVYVTDITNRSVSKWTPGTKSPVILPFTGLVKPTGIAVDTAGNVYVSDLDQNHVLKLPVI